ncbi:MAG TPA: FtsQ-type POTRA domain-containing protein, partial [Acidobacteriaceae bacterium]|nr:FtsQ-type POTRA domain-containing protein [Acidobacteriaceae bacterium]
KTWVGRTAFAGGVLLACGAVWAGLTGARQALLHDGRFVVTTSSDIQITGNEHLTRGQVLSVFGADLERNIFRVPLAERKDDLERLPWVAHATVMRLLPGKIRVAITERTPVAFVRQGTRIGLVDASGVLLDMPANAAGDPHYSFPVLTGLSSNDPLSTRAARMAIYERFMRELDGAGEKLTGSLSEVDVSSPEDVKAVVASGSSDILVHFGDEKFLERYHQFQQHLPEWKQQYPKLASADMRYERQVVLEMQPGTAVPLAESGPAPAAAGAVTGAAEAAAPPERPKAVNHPLAHAPVHGAGHPLAAHAPGTVHAKAKPAVSAGKGRSPNGRIVAEQAAARRTEQKKKAAHAAARPGVR